MANLMTSRNHIGEPWWWPWGFDRSDALDGRFNSIWKRSETALDMLGRELTNIDIQDTEDTKTGTRTISMDLPGVKKEDLKITIEDGALTVQAKRQGRAIARQIYVGDVGPPTAKLQDGVLTLSFVGVKPRKIEVPVE